MNLVHRLFTAWVIGLALLGVTFGPGQPAAGAAATLFDDPVLVRGKGFEVRRSELEERVTSLRGTLAAQGQNIPDGARERLAAQTLDRLILARVLALRATAEDKDKARELANRFVAENKAKARSPESYRRQLVAVGLKPEVFEERAFEQAIVDVVVGRELKSTIAIGPEQIRAFYDEGIDGTVREVQAVVQRLETEGKKETVFYRDGLKRIDDLKKANLARLDRPETVRARMIVLYLIEPVSRLELTAEEQQAKEARARKLLERARRGEDFAALAREFSEDPDVERTGGEYVATRDVLPHPQVRAALFSLPVDQVSDVIRTPTGLYVVKVLERQPAGKMPFDRAEPVVRQMLTDQEAERRLPQYFDQLKKDYAIEVLPAARDLR